MSKEAGKMNDTILEVKDLSVTFTQYERGFSRRTIHAVEKMDLEIKSGEIVAVVGSSGSGKSLLAHAIMGILPYNSEMDGEIRFLGEPLTEGCFCEGKMPGGAEALWLSPGYPGKIPISALRRHDAACPDLHGGDGEAKARHRG